MGLAFGVVLRPPQRVLEVASLIIGPMLFVLVLVNYKRTMRSLGVMRTLGALAGLLAFYALYRNEEFSRSIYVLRVPGVVLLLFTAVALALIATGLLVAEYVWRRIYGDRTR